MIEGTLDEGTSGRLHGWAWDDTNPDAGCKVWQPLREDVHVYRVLRTHRWKFFSKKKLPSDLREDPNEQTSEYETEPGIVSTLEDRVRELIREDRTLYGALESSVTEEDAAAALTEKKIKNLRSLGYIDP